jgi:UDP-N-acetylmuramoyl-tripeptide--D-alanyl-D-alanine ligase
MNMLQANELHQYFLQCDGISTDTRKIKANSLFFALKGGIYNGNQFAQEALSKGARYAVIDDAYFKNSEQCLLVEDVLKTLQDLANFHRKQHQIPLLAITGTNGKTTTKELVNVVLSTKFSTKATQGNLNNHIGVPLTLLEVNAKTAMAVIEMGANRVGDIQELCAIAEPNFGLITNIGLAHLEGFGSFEGVLRAKSELYDHLLKKGGAAFINAQNPILHNMGKRFERSENAEVIYYGTNDSYYHVEMLSASPYITYKTETGEIIKTKLLGAYNFDNILAALCIANYFGVSMASAHHAVANYSPTNNRSQVIEKEHNTIILDAYNANPSSMKVALENFEQMSVENKVVILGDMFELGKFSEEKHKEVIDLVWNMNFQQVFFCGQAFYSSKNVSQSNKLFHFFETKEVLKQYLQDNMLKNSYLLIKGSRGMGLESLVEILW